MSERLDFLDETLTSTAAATLDRLEQIKAETVALGDLLSDVDALGGGGKPVRSALDDMRGRLARQRELIAAAMSGQSGADLCVQAIAQIRNDLSGRCAPVEPGPERGPTTAASGLGPVNLSAEGAAVDQHEADALLADLGI